MAEETCTSSIYGGKSAPAPPPSASVIAAANTAAAAPPAKIDPNSLGTCGPVRVEDVVNTNTAVFIESLLYNDKRVLHVHGGSTANGTDLTLWSRREAGNQLNLQWYITSTPEGNFFLRSCLDPTVVAHQHGGSCENDAKCTVWDSKSAGTQPNMQVKFDPQDGFCYSIRFVHSNKCMHVRGGALANGTPISQWDYVPQDNLKWRIVPVHHTATHFVNPEHIANTGRRVFVESVLGAPGCVMHVHGGAMQNGTDLTLWNRTNFGHQTNLQWTITTTKEGNYALNAVGNPAFVAHQHGASNDNGSKCSLWDSREAGSQGNMQVRFDAHDGAYAIRFIHSNKCIHVHGGAQANGTPLTQWEYVDQVNLKWRFIPCTPVFADAAPAPAAPATVPLNLWWNGTRNDNFLTTPGQGETDAKGAGYTFIRTVGKCYVSQIPGTVPLNVFWNGARNDNFTCAHPQGESDARGAGYTFIRTMGYVYPASAGAPAGHQALKVFWNGSRSDNFTTAANDAQGNSDAAGAGYTFIRDDCFIPL